LNASIDQAGKHVHSDHLMAIVNGTCLRVGLQVPAERQAARSHGRSPSTEISGDTFGRVADRFQRNSRALAHVAEHPVDDELDQFLLRRGKPV
jgi:hypothetical protein